MGQGSDRRIAVLRGTAAASAATFTAAASHTLGGGEAPAPVTIALTLAFAVPLSTALVGRRLPLVRLGAAVALSQVLCHVLFTLSGSANGAARPHLHGAAVHLPPILGHAPAQMSASHVAAAVLTVALLARGESTLRAVLHAGHLAAMRWRRLPVPVPLLPPPGPAPGAEPTGRFALLLLPLTLRHRGPPAPAA